MSSFTFEYPYLIAIIIPLLYCIYKCRFYAEPKIFVHLHLFSNIKHFKNLDLILKALVLLALTIALASPVFVDRHNPLNRDGRDIVLAIDGSGSMNASGFSSDEKERLSRFETVQKIAGEFIKKRAGDNVGIVFYGDFAFIASPITYEKEIVVDMLSYLNHGMAGQNTAIGEAIAMSVRAFKHSKAKSKIIILLTDGEHNSGEVSPKEATALAVGQNIKIHTIGIGNKGEADEALLQEIANSSGGEFFGAQNSKELQKIYELIDESESSKIKSKDYLFKDFYYYVFLLFALAIVLFMSYREVRR